MPARDYAPLANASLYGGGRAARMRSVVDRIWNAFESAGVSWVGFYLPDRADDGDVSQLVLGPSRNKPACSPIGLHGACGQVYLSKKPLIVRDVADLGEGYIACDPRDRSEVVAPLIDTAGACTAVLDLDSFDVGAFDDGDARGLQSVLVAAGLTSA